MTSILCCSYQIRKKKITKSNRFLELINERKLRNKKESPYKVFNACQSRVNFKSETYEYLHQAEQH